MPRRALNYTPGTRIAEARTTDDLIEIMDEETYLEKRRDILETMSPKLREKYDWIRGWLERQNQSLLRSYYELGEQVQEIYLDETSNGSKVYGRFAIQRICTVLDWDDSLIRL